MAFIEESVIKKYSVVLPYIGGAVSILALVLQAALDSQVIPLQYQVIVTSFVIPALAHLGRKWKQTPDEEVVVTETST